MYACARGDRLHLQPQDLEIASRALSLSLSLSLAKLCARVLGKKRARACMCVCVCVYPLFARRSCREMRSWIIALPLTERESPERAWLLEIQRFFTREVGPCPVFDEPPYIYLLYNFIVRY